MQKEVQRSNAKVGNKTDDILSMVISVLLCYYWTQLVVGLEANLIKTYMSGWTRKCSEGYFQELPLKISLSLKFSGATKLG